MPGTRVDLATLIEAWASLKSFRPQDEDDDDTDNNGWSDFKGKKRSNETHESKTDPEGRLMRKSNGQEAKMSFMGHILMENRNGLVADSELITQANGYAERQAALRMLVLCLIPSTPGMRTTRACPRFPAKRPGRAKP